MKPTDEELFHRFSYHRPDEEAILAHADVNELFLPFAKMIRDICPEGRNLALALTHLEDARMRANAAIAVEGTAVRAKMVSRNEPQDN